MIELNNYPKAKEKYIEWCISKYKVIFPDVDLKGKEAEKFAELSLQGGMQNLFYFFDERGIFVEIEYYSNRKEFGYSIEDIDNPLISSSRRDCELRAFTHAFEILEEQLSEKEETV